MNRHQRDLVFEAVVCVVSTFIGVIAFGTAGIGVMYLGKLVGVFP